MPSTSNDEKDLLTHKICGELVEAMLEADRNRCESLIEGALLNNLTPVQIFDSVISVALNRIGALWHKGSITIAHEHGASEIAQNLIDFVSDKTPHLSSNGLTAVVAGVEGEQHVLGAKFFSALLEVEGWTVHYLGSSLPSDDLVQYVVEKNVDAIVLTIVLPKNIDHVEQCLKELQKLDSPPVVLVGGRAVIGKELEGAVVAKNLVSGLTLLESNFGMGSSMFTLDDILLGIGQNIQDIRKSRGMNQGQLAEAAGVDRAYISLVENGKQNLTLAALVKLSEALSVPVSGVIPVSTYRR